MQVGLRHQTQRRLSSSIGYVWLQSTSGVDFQESYSPVINDTILQILSVLQLALCLHGIIIDIETAFLNGELTEEIYMNTPEGLDAAEDECVRKAIYGLVQSM
jgi:Reverse transcriptase (RNA-dependent DNA polymerase)